uniref:Uncharacterized protein n=1 Tax=Arundo donax TaxID=35708 RepID=A0A0A9BBY2_ARUDO
MEALTTHCNLLFLLACLLTELVLPTVSCGDTHIVQS